MCDPGCDRGRALQGSARLLCSGFSCGEAFLKPYPFNSSFGESRAAIHLVAIQLFFGKGGDQYSGAERINHCQEKAVWSSFLSALLSLRQNKTEPGRERQRSHRAEVGATERRGLGRGGGHR